MNGPSPDTRFPIEGIERTAFLAPFITRPNIEVGDYTYYDDPKGPERFEENVLYHFDFLGDRLIIGKFCSIAAETRFVMNGGNHAVDGISTYPFSIFGHGWEDAEPEAWPHKGDTVVGHDVWIGYGATILPGVTVGHGAVIAACSVVTKDVEPYAIVGGNPARVIRHRLEPEVVEELLEMAWWDWPIETVTEKAGAIVHGDLERLRA